ncbi:PREDICTED: aquaporin NIP3-1 isoform X2 [Camelina sativa]|uniref:Aquaporin NIP3-1 isoform X2 n=1 Tax=Camelina sativa TaxID=90675 RepID=A0ABM1RED2_CAMSA|nr:PREDICTED: aquaporin NIP3-1 isoform X2 [Camelina sativa]
MAEISDITTQTQITVLEIEDGQSGNHSSSPDVSGPLISVSFVQKLIGEFVGTFTMIFAGCSAIVVNETYGKPVTLPGIALVWGLTVMVMIYSIGHVSGAHFNPAVSIAFASSKRFPFNQANFGSIYESSKKLRACPYMGML